MTETKTTATDRDRTILKIVVEDFVQTAHPVASKRLKDEYSLHLSPASIRNTLHGLEEAGFLGHLHTSSGRVPTDTGYRFYVDELLGSPVPSSSVQRIAMKELAAASSNADRLLQITANSLGQLSNLFGFAVLEAEEDSELTDLDLVKLSSGQVLMVVGFKSEKVQTVLLNLSLEIKDSLIDMINSLLKERLVGLTVSEITGTIADRLRGQVVFDSELVQVIIENAEEYFAISSENGVFVSSKDQLWQHPEFSSPSDMRIMMRALDNSETIRVSASLPSKDDETILAIGGENPTGAMHDCSVVTRAVGVGEKEVISFGVIGPTRMNYGEVISVLDVFATTITRLKDA
ncbi:MAG: heat-inducible transcriptional repressor HrcA [Candidatus Neomarinimicrobiota bacterium]|nr:heat-inducible transcriptional repressor HrcA [Candidatus Neomarinimicrobiota bacterium]